MRRLAAGVALFAATSAATAGDTIRIMVAGIDKQIYLPATLAQRLGYFTAQGLNVELLSEASGVHAEDQLRRAQLVRRKVLQMHPE